MPKRGTGHVRCVNGVFIARISVEADRREDFALPTCTTESEARERSERLATIAKKLRPCLADAASKRKALEFVSTASAKTLPIAISVAEELLGVALATASDMAPTFKAIGDRWTSGELAKQFPDQIRAKRSASDDETRLRLHVYPLLQDVPIDRVTLDHCENVMRSLPADMATNTRRRVGQTIVRLLNLAVYPLRLIERNPLPPGFLPAVATRKALAYLYPTEDARLMRCEAVPLCYRLMWGFFAREGTRLSEALKLTWSDVDLVRGAVCLDENKTDDHGRTWALSPGVVAALRVYREAFRKGAASTDCVFVDELGEPFKVKEAAPRVESNRRRKRPGNAPSAPASTKPFAELLRAHLKQIGLHNERPEIFESSDVRQAMRVHDLRGTFVTVSLANGRSESWISDRTGHRDSQMIARYKRIARTFGELHLGTLEPLDTAIPELAIHSSRSATNNHEVLEPPAKLAESLSHLRDLNSRPTVYECELSVSQLDDTAQLLEKVDFTGSPEHLSASTPGASLAVIDNIEATLADALSKAAAAGEWQTVSALAAELNARRQARSGVASIADARKRRDGGAS